MKNKFFPVSNMLLTNKIIKDSYHTFWFEVSRKFTDDNYLAVILKIQFEDENILSLTDLVKVTKGNKTELLDYILGRSDLKDESYKTIPIIGIIYSYKFREGRIKGLFPPKNIDNKSFYMILDTKNRYELPVAYNVEDYGKVILELNLPENKKYYEIYLGKDKYLKIIQDKNINKISYFKKGIEIYNWTDKIISNTELTRNIKEKVITFKENKVVLTSANRRFKSIKKLIKKPNPKLDNDFLTADIETILVDGIHIPFLISTFDGQKSKSFFTKDINLTEKLVKKLIEYLFTKNNNNKIVYLHNFAGFDVLFIFKYLIKFTEVKPLIHNGEFITVESKYKNIKLKFRDSYKHLVSSLDNLAKNFGVENKDIFPYFLNDLNYSGNFPEFKFFDKNKVSLEEYEKIKEQFAYKIWNFKDESIKYCEQDCRTLHQVISRYNELFFRNFGFNIHKYTTLPSLAFANYRTNFMEKENIANITGKVYKDIKLGYTGGATEMYIPKPPPLDIKIHAYDVNSLYPSVMLNNKYPVGNPTFFIGNILNSKDKPFGFFYCKIKTPENILHPIIQIHYKTTDGVRTISPLGNFEGMFFSEELYNAEKYGYKFEVLWGYTFESEFIFKDYVEIFIYFIYIKYKFIII